MNTVPVEDRRLKWLSEFTKARPFLIAETLELQGVVTAVDPANHTAQLTFEGGKRQTLDVRPDIKLDQSMIGQRILLRVTDAIAMSVTGQ